MKARSALIVISLIGLGLGATAQEAHATFHMMKVTEVFAGQTLQPNADMVELQMYQAGQNQVSGHKLTLYEASGTAHECTISSNVANATNQAHILFATTEAQSLFGSADFTIPAFLSGSSGAACFEGIDCVTWGSFGGSVSDTKGPVVSPEAAIPDGQSIHRSLGANATLEDPDDTNNSADDFAPGSESGTPNGVANLGTLTCTGGGGGGGGGTDDKVPSSEITAPKHKTAITVNESTNFQGTASDQGGSQVAKVEIALRQKIKGGGCKWWSGSAFAAGSCSEKIFQTATGDKKWSYDLPRKLKPTGRKLKAYRLFSRATDGDGNVETLFEAGRNLVKFEVYKTPIVCGQPHC
jgi:hypothetical protein